MIKTVQTRVNGYIQCISPLNIFPKNLFMFSACIFQESLDQGPGRPVVFKSLLEDGELLFELVHY